ncbi:hypothetical protein HDV05_001382 [Chytridiales sp. JEL 0842]|nr:hypothetical protein HDV05_001382 [Chytridiales sp. JEL 0842]
MLTVRPTTSYWDRLPLEIQLRILRNSDALTIHLNSHKHPRISNLLPIDPSEVWREAFIQDWNGNLNLLPKGKLPYIDNGLELVRSRRMYKRLCRLIPGLTEDNTYCNHSNRLKNKYDIMQFYQSDKENARVLHKFLAQNEARRLVHVCLRNVWMDLIPVESYPIAYARLAIQYNHLEALKYIVDVKKWVDLNKFGRDFAYPVWYRNSPGGGGNGDSDCRFSEVFDAPVVKADVPMMQYLYDHGCRPSNSSDKFLNALVRSNQLECIQYLHQLGINSNNPDATLAQAIEFGRVEIIEWMMRVWGFSLKENHIDQALHTENNDLLRFLYKLNLLPSDTEDTLDTVAAVGDLELLSILNDADFPASPAAMDQASKNGHLHVVQYLHTHRSEGCTTDAMDDASANGHLSIVKFLHENRSEGCTQWALDTAAQNGHLAVVEFLHTHRSEGCTEAALDEASKNGFLDIVEFLHTHRSEGCTKDAMNFAAAHGHLDVVRYLHLNRSEGCTAWAMDMAAKNGYFHVVKFLNEHRSEKSTRDAIEEAQRNRHTHIVQYLKRHGSVGGVFKMGGGSPRSGGGVHVHQVGRNQGGLSGGGGHRQFVKRKVSLLAGQGQNSSATNSSNNTANNVGTQECKFRQELNTADATNNTTNNTTTNNSNNVKVSSNLKENMPAVGTAAHPSMAIRRCESNGLENGDTESSRMNIKGK